MGWGNNALPSHGYIKPAEEYEPHKLIGFEIKIDNFNPNKNIDIIICYEHLQPHGKGGFNKRALYKKDKNNLDIKLKPNEPELICSKLNELGFKTKFTCSKASNNKSFAIILEE